MRKSDRGITLISFIISIIVLIFLIVIIFNINGKEKKIEEQYVEKNTTLYEGESSPDNPVIPKGFKAVDANIKVKKGFIIEDRDGNQFVWVPIYDIDNFVEESIDGSGYQGKLDLYSYGQGTTENREPATIPKSEYPIPFTNEYNYYDEDIDNIKAIIDEGYDISIEGLEKQFQDEFNDMAKSVKTYGGFYVGRFETSWTGEKVASVRTNSIFKEFTGATFLEENWKVFGSNQASWYGLYAKQKELYKKNSDSSVVSGMIYGCQWDAIVNWMLEDISTSRYVKKKKKTDGIAVYTGSDEKNKAKNIYDLAGNGSEWTQEATGTGERVYRGIYWDVWGAYAYIRCREATSPYPANHATRLQLYIK